MKLRWPHHYFKKHKRLPYLLMLLVPAVLYFANQGHRYFEGRQVFRDLRNIHNAGDWYRYGADRNVKEAQYNLALLYQRGFTLPRNDAEAFKWMSKASDQDFAMAQNELGTYYELGIGVSKDTTEAAKLYQKAADQNLPSAMNHLASLMVKGDGIPEDKTAAAKWFERAATAGFIMAQINLAKMYQRGNGIAADPARAYAWLSVADYGTDHSTYQKPIDEMTSGLINSMDEKTRTDAKAMADLYISQYGDLTRNAFMNVLKVQRKN